ncbi:hypothetical protein ONR07_24490, partial [Salmonella enterica subsp. enterica serovar Anatum]|nr:hypothetical protein [Salmonella enterica subsp. enterica serovar Anatum]
GGPLATTADYQDPWLQRQLENRGWVLWAPVRFGANTINFATTLAVVAALRETSILFGALIAWLLLKEKVAGLRLVAAGGIALGA